MKALAVTLFLIVAGPVTAQDFDAPKAAHMAYDASARCKMQDAPDACRTRDTLWIVMQVHGYCWQDAEQVFTLCSDTNPENPENKAIYR